MPRFHVEFDSVISAGTEHAANELAERIAVETRSAYRFRLDGGPDAVVAAMDCAVVVPKIPLVDTSRADN